MNNPSAKPVCVVTGSSSGIGAATALLFAQQGHNVVINYVKKAEPAQNMAEQCREAGADVLVVQGDVADDAQCRALADAVRHRWGRADVLVNNAGISTKFADIKDLDALSEHDFEATYRVNVIGAYQMSRALAPLLKAGPLSAIVNISSLAGRMGAGSSIAYACSKGALNTLTLALARSLAPQVRVNAILPGMIDGDWMRNGLGPEVFEQRRQRWESRALLNAVMSVQDVARTAHWLATGATKSTGQLIDIEAGFVLG
ncbi:SDR family NAD(P)-dependent oxidoreductase [Hydrogenophaga sp. BPS33]|uniref:SDR family NAD(P)-dependent oxidoreductase n=1 Tax=Hydrogenophaga sp. BPS33 TaxID=2651974 RepID=UPI00131F7281|nr:SDR family oxidoreductase [Hydrogenophaga sp. BPS33]QHE87272.1 SDR family oxidoreductase [Hydrogenophaga sp. BPS33]